MPVRNRPTPEDAVAASQILLDGLARGAELPELLEDLEPLHPRGNTFPGEVFLHLAAGALAWCGASRADPIALEGLRERFLPAYTWRGRDRRRKLQFAVLAAAALHGGAEPDLLDEVIWWQSDDFWHYALLATVAYIRAAAERAGVPVSQVCEALNARPA